MDKLQLCLGHLLEYKEIFPRAWSIVMYVIFRNESSKQDHDRCPSSAPYSYHHGRYCCESTNQGFDDTLGTLCNGSEIYFTSACCETSSVKCENPPCVDYNFATNFTDCDASMVYQPNHKQYATGCLVKLTTNLPTKPNEGRNIFNAIDATGRNVFSVNRNSNGKLTVCIRGGGCEKTVVENQSFARLDIQLSYIEANKEVRLVGSLNKEVFLDRKTDATEDITDVFFYNSHPTRPPSKADVVYYDFRRIKVIGKIYKPRSTEI